MTTTYTSDSGEKIMKIVDVNGIRLIEGNINSKNEFEYDIYEQKDGGVIEIEDMGLDVDTYNEKINNIIKKLK